MTACTPPHAVRAADAGMSTEPMTDNELRARWIKAGGRFHGPNIETGTMPESKLLPFLRQMVEAQQAFLDHCADPECMVCGQIMCPHKEPLHFHHDGCPACAREEPPR